MIPQNIVLTSFQVLLHLQGMPKSKEFLESPIEFLKGVGPVKGNLLKTEVGVYTFNDLLMHFPFRYVDKTQFHKVRDINSQSDTVQLRGILRRLNVVGSGRGRRLVGAFRDDTGMIELVWFKGVHFLEKTLLVGAEYVLYGKVNNFKGKITIPHPEMEIYDPVKAQQAATFAPVYPSTEKLNAKGLDAKGRRKIMETLLSQITPDILPENLPDYIVQKFRFPSHFAAIQKIHFPANQKELDAAIKRLKFEELFFLQLRLLQIRRRRKDAIKGFLIGFFRKNYPLN